MLISFFYFATCGISTQEILQRELFDEITKIISTKLDNLDYFISDKSSFEVYDEIILLKDTIKLTKKYKEDYIDQIIELNSFIDKNGLPNQNFEKKMLDFLNKKNNKHNKILVIRIINSTPHFKNFVLKMFKNNNREYKRVLIDYNYHGRLESKNIVSNLFETFNIHDEMILQFYINNFNKFIIIEIPFLDFPMKNTIKYFLKNIKHLTDKRIMNIETQFFNFMCDDTELYLAMLFYKDNSEEYFIKRRSIKNAGIKFEKNLNIFIKDFDIQIIKEGIKINNKIYYLNEKKGLEKINVNNYNFIRDFILGYNQMLYKEYLVIFYIFNGTRNTQIFDFVLRNILTKDKNNNKLFLLSYLLNSMGLLKESDMKILLQSTNKNLDIENIIKNIKKEINHFINEDIYKGFIFLYYLSLDELVKKNKLKEFEILNNEEVMNYIRKKKSNLVIRNLKDVLYRDLCINKIFSSKFYQIFDFSYRYLYHLSSIKEFYIKKILDVTKFVLYGINKTSKDNLPDDQAAELYSFDFKRYNNKKIEERLHALDKND